jgi:DNA-binding response OmpR family regulator
MINILHLEDEGPLREILKVAVTAFDPSINMQQFVNSDQALNYAQDHIGSLNMCILDIRVPGSLDGMDFAQKLREIGYKGMIVITSAYRQPQQTLLQQLNCDWMAKPWHVLEATETLIPRARQSLPA